MEGANARDNTVFLPFWMVFCDLELNPSTAVTYEILIAATISLVC